MFTVFDIEGVLLAVMAGGVVLVLPGMAVARLLAAPGRPLLPAIPVAFAVLPALTSLVARFAGLDVALGADLALALAGGCCLSSSVSRHARPDWAICALLGVWLLLVLVEWVDFDVGGRLYQPVTVFDAVKHAATTQAIADGGVPPRDAFFLRPERASYYYFFYTLTALVERCCLGWADAKAAVGGTIFWLGVGLFMLIDALLARMGIVLRASGTRRVLLVLAVLCVGGFDVVPLLVYAAWKGIVLVDPLCWNEQVSIWSASLFWVPHHVAALVAAAVALIALCDVAGPSTPAVASRGGVLATVAIVSTLGLSIWVCFALAVATGVWTLLLAIEGRRSAVLWIIVVGLAAFVLAMPVLADLHAGRGGEAIPIAVAVRAFTLTDLFVAGEPWRTAARLFALPLNYLIEFGAFAIGAYLYWRRPRQAAGTDIARLVAIAAATGLALGALLQSTIHNNDLGWRVTLFPMLAGTLWTIAVVDRAWGERTVVEGPARRPRLLVAGLGLGWATSLSVLVAMRAYPWLPIQPSARFMQADPRTMRALRVAYGWAGTHLPHGEVLQHDPVPHRSFAFGLYGRNPTSVSDEYAGIYGVGDDAVVARLATIAALYHEPLSADRVKRVARTGGIDALVVTAADPVWKAAGSFVWTTPPLYASDRVRIIAVDRLGG